MNVSYWAQIERPDGTTHGSCVVSPIFASSHELAAWVRTTIRPVDRVHAYRRESTSGSFRDSPLSAKEQPLADPERLRTILAIARASVALAPPPKFRERHDTAKSPTSSFDPTAHMPTYADVYAEKEPE